MDVLGKFFDKSARGSSFVAKKRLQFILSQEREKISAGTHPRQTNSAEGFSPLAEGAHPNSRVVAQ